MPSSPTAPSPLAPPERNCILPPRRTTRAARPSARRALRCPFPDGGPSERGEAGL
jgi:hypothetical protein